MHVIDVNDEAPWFEQSQYEVEISENQPPGTSVLTVSATDLDQGLIHNVQGFDLSYHICAAFNSS